MSRTDRDADYVIAGIPMDIGTTNRSGTRDGPAAIRRASRMLTDGDHPEHWVEPARMTCPTSAISRSRWATSRAAWRRSSPRPAAIGHLIALGGEHGITLPLLRALTQRLGRPVALVHFDAHVDTWPDNFGQAYAHGSPFYHAINEGLVDPHRMIQIGIRSPVQKDVMDWTLSQGVTVLSAQDVHASSPAAVAARIAEVVGDVPAYLSFDIDALDPAFAPGTGTPEIGGLATVAGPGHPAAAGSGAFRRDGCRRGFARLRRVGDHRAGRRDYGVGVPGASGRAELCAERLARPPKTHNCSGIEDPI